MRRILFFLVIIFFILNISLHEKLFNKIENIKKHNRDVLILDEKFYNVFIPDFLKPLTADLLWIKLTPKIDLNKCDAETGFKLYKYMMLITDLDPYFYLAYLLGGTFLSAKDRFNMYKQGIAILEKGMKNLRNKWDLYFLAGFFTYFEQKNREKGLKYFQQCLNLETTPEDIKKL